MKKLLIVLALIALAIAYLVPTSAASAAPGVQFSTNEIAPDCAYAEVKLYTHWYQSGLQGSDCSDSIEHAFDVNFGDSSDAFRTVDNNDTDSWKVWTAYSQYEHCLIFWDSAAGGGSAYTITLYAGGTVYWGNLPSSWINRASRYSLIAINPSAAC